MHSGRCRSRGVWRGLVLSFCLLSVLAGCATPGVPVRETAQKVIHRLEADGILAARPAADLESIYDAAVARSSVFRQEHQSADLWPVNGATAMGSLSSCDCPSGGCSSKCSLKPGQQVAPTDIWLSRSDQFQQFCQSLPPGLTREQVILKLQQLLGMPPQVNPDPCTWKVLQVQVDGLQVPNQFFRPCTNPDPTTTGPCTADFTNAPPSATTPFRAWMAGQAFSAWRIPNGYPWTHLGYTYNWDPKAASLVGVSEYVIPQGTPIQVMGLVPAVALCAPSLTCP